MEKFVGRELGNKVSSLFDISRHKELKNVGSSTVSFLCEPTHEEETQKVKKIYYENTYRLEPPSKFRADKVQPIIEEVLQKHLEGRKYDPIECSIMSKTLAEEIKQRVKELDFKRQDVQDIGSIYADESKYLGWGFEKYKRRRYKFVAVVIIGQKTEQGVQIGSRYLWDADRDNYAAGSYHNRHVFCVGSVYAMYYE